MKKLSIKALGATLLTAGLVLAGVVAPAQAAGNWLSNANYFYTGSGSALAFQYGATNLSRPRVSFQDQDGWSNTIYVKIVGVVTPVQNCTVGTNDMGMFLPAGATLAAGFPTSNPAVAEYASSCTIASSGSGATSAVTFSFGKTSGAVTGTATVAIGTDVLQVDSAATDVKAYVSTDNSTWALVGTATGIGYGLTLDANGGSRMYSQPGTTVVKSNATATWTAISANTAQFVRGGYTFDGWTTDPQGANTLYTTGASVPLSTSTNTLYAKWTAVGGSTPSSSPSVAPSSSGSSSSGSVATALTIGAATGGVVAGSSVAITASGLQTTAAYSVVVQSTPQTIGSGNAVAGAVSSSVTLPSGLEAGWHTLTFTSTAADGSAVESKVYFQVSASGTLLATTSTIPAELANTGFNSAPYLATGAVLAFAGAVLMLFARRRQTI